MLLLIVWIAVVVAAVVVLGSIAYGLVGSFSRLGGEMAALDRQVRPVLAEVQDTSDKLAQRRSA